MSLHFVTGDLFDRYADVRVNTVNCVGVMGKGVALAFKRRYPTMFADYRRACFAGEVKPGRLHVWKAPGSLLTIVNFPTKRDWRDDSRYEDIEIGLIALRDYLEPMDRGHVTLPALGCGHGGLAWESGSGEGVGVKTMISCHLAGLFADIWVYSPEDSRR